MTPDDIRSQDFGRRLLWGLIPEEVSAFLDDVGDAYDNAQKWNASLTARVRELETESRRWKRGRPRRRPYRGAQVRDAAGSREVGARRSGPRADAGSMRRRSAQSAMLQDAEAAKAQLQIEGRGVTWRKRQTEPNPCS